MRHTVSSPQGNQREFAPGDKTTAEYDLLQCCHCERWWKVVPGSGRTRGWCGKCMKPHCGGPKCWECTPNERRWEQGDQLMRQIERMMEREQLGRALGLQK
jgi:hypothetical protein